MLGSNSVRCFGFVFSQIDICEVIWQQYCYFSLFQLKTQNYVTHNFFLLRHLSLSLFAVHLQNRLLLFLVSLLPFEGAAQNLRFEGSSESCVSQTCQEVHCIYVHFLAPITVLLVIYIYLFVKVWRFFK